MEINEKKKYKFKENKLHKILYFLLRTSYKMKNR